MSENYRQQKLIESLTSQMADLEEIALQMTETLTALDIKEWKQIVDLKASRIPERHTGYMFHYVIHRRGHTC